MHTKIEKSPKKPINTRSLKKIEESFIMKDL